MEVIVDVKNEKIRYLTMECLNDENVNCLIKDYLDSYRCKRVLSLDLGDL